MFIVLEGVDLAGKSTLARDIKDEILRVYPNDEVQILHSGPLHEDPLDAYVFRVNNYKPGSRSHIITDRWHYGEKVYGPLYRGASAINTATWRWIELWLQTRGARTWVVTNTPEEITRRYVERGDDFLKMKDIEHVITKFNEVATDTVTCAGTAIVGTHEQLNNIIVDKEQLIHHIINDAMHAESRAELFASMSSSYLGRTFVDPITLLVGDKRGGTSPHQTTSAFCTMNSSSGKFLWDALNSDTWASTAVVNINDDEHDLSFLFEWLENSRIVALGQEAVKSLKKLDLKFGSVPHPQYVRRFHHAKQQEYGTIIRRTSEDGRNRSKWPN